MKHTTNTKHNLRRATMTLVLMLACAMAWAQTTVTTTYLNADGTIGSHEAIAITQNYMPTTLGAQSTETWYVVTENVNYDYIPQCIALWGHVKLILSDGCTMTVNTFGNLFGIDGYQGSHENAGKGSLTIYGQQLNSGTLDVGASLSAIGVAYGYTQHSGNVTAHSDFEHGIRADNDVVIDGGQVTAYGHSGITTQSDLIISGGQVNAISTYIASGGAPNLNYRALFSKYGSITISGGQVTANGYGGVGIYCQEGDITLGWTHAPDHIYASNYQVAGNHTVSIAEGQVLYTNDATPVAVSGTVIDLNQINDKTLSPNYAADFSQTGNDEYTIHTAIGWNYFCDFIENGETFDNKTVKLGVDIEVSRMAGREGKDFKGSFEGNNKVLTINYNGNEDYMAPFRYISNDARFSNLEVRGTINSAEGSYAAGLVGHLYGSVMVEHCSSFVDITSSSGAGGFVGLCEHAVEFSDCLCSAIIHSAGGNNGGFVGWSRSSAYTITFRGCLFNGKLLQLNSSGGANGGFLGWKGDAKTVNITDCLYDPAPLSDGETYASGSSATFSREHTEYAATITNSYYSTTFGTAQGKQIRSITMEDEHVTASVDEGSVYTISGITTFNTGIRYHDVLYSGNENQVSLWLENTPPAGYAFYGYTASPDGATISGDSNPYTLTMPDADVVVGAIFQELVNYLDMSGTEQLCDNYVTLTGDETTLSEGWYVAEGTISYDHPVSVTGDVNIILKNNAKINIGTEESPVTGNGIGDDENGSFSLNVYGQRMDGNNGQLNVYASNNAIFANSGNVTICGGQVTVFGNNQGFLAGAGHSITLGWTKATDCIYANSYSGTVNIIEGRTFIDIDSNPYSGNGISGISGKKLYPDCVFLKSVAGHGDNDGGWVFISSPIVGSLAPTAIDNLIGAQIEGSNLYDFDLYRFNQSADNVWEDYHQHSDDFDIVNGQGYLYATKENRTLVFAGELSSHETIRVDLVYDASANHPGWNLLGNPFTTDAYINKPYYKLNAEGTDVVPVARYWNHSFPAFTGVMVHADAENETATFIKTEPKAMGDGCLLVTLTKNDTSEEEHDRVIVNFNEGVELEKFVFNENHSKICVPKNGKDYAIVFSEKTGEMPLCFKAVTDGEFSLSVIPEAVETTYLHLIDNLTGEDFDLLATPVYSFSALASGDYASRFRLEFSANGVEENENDNQNENFAYINNGEIIVETPWHDVSTIQIIDMMGRILLTRMVTPHSSLLTPNSPGVYVLRLTTGEIVRTQKIVIR